jgi:Fe-S-cluster containining protein
MTLEEFKEKVKKLSAERGIIWVTVPLVYDKSLADSIRTSFAAMLQCQQCGKCCNGFWFQATPIFLGDYGKILGMGTSVFEFEDMSKLIDDKDHKIVCLSQPCHFLEDGKCSIYGSRPLTCKWFPIMLEDSLRINISCPAGLELYLNMVEKYHLKLDSEGI